MQLFPAIEDFAAAFGAGRNQVVWTRLVADLDTPVSLMLKLTEARKDSFLLESVTGGEVRGRYSIMGMKPDLIWECRGTRARLNRAARFDADGFARRGGRPARQPARADRREPDRAAARAAADGGRPLRLSRLRHGAAGRASAATSTPTRSACPTRSCCAPRWCWWSTG